MSKEKKIKEMLRNIADRQVKRASNLKLTEKKELLAYLKENSEDREDGKCLCHYCGIDCGENGENFLKIWKHPCYAREDKDGKRTGRMNLEIEHKNNLISLEKRFEDYWDLGNLTLACPICNIAKSDQFTYDEFKKVGNVIREIWEERKNKLL